jgi:hypothetical protein
MRKGVLPKSKLQAALDTLAGQKSMALYGILAVILLCLLANADGVHAAESSIKVTQNGILKGDLVMRFRAEEIFTEKVTKFLNRGFTVRIEYKIELWRSRRYWFDRLDSQHSISYQIDFEPLEKRYICLKSQEGTAITSKLDRQLDRIIEWTTRPEPALIVIPLERLNQEAKYYYSIEILIATLTTENIKHLQKWLEYGGKEKETSTVTGTSFRLARDFLSSRNRRKISERSGKFYLHALPKLDNASGLATD